MLRLMVLGIVVSQSIATQRTVTRTVSRWFPQAMDSGTVPLSYHVLKSPALDFAPWLELHHVVLLGAPGSSKVFAIDYSPLNQQASLIKLFKGISVPAEIRVRMIDANSVLDIQDIKRKWMCMGADKASCNDEHVDGKVVTMDELNMMVKNDENLRVVRDVIERIYRKWSCKMNLYTHNCQHFSYFVGDLLSYERVCSVDAPEDVTTEKKETPAKSVTVSESLNI